MPWTIAAWIGATWAGWLLGLLLIIGFAVIGDAIGLSGVQSLVGAGMGVGVGFTQARLVRRRLVPAFWPWFRSCAIGITAPFLVTDILNAVGLGVPYSLQLAVTIGGLLAGLMQTRILEKRFRHARSWIVASTVGWLLAAATSGTADMLFQAKQLRGIGGALLYVGVIAAGGLLLGMVTSLPLSRLLRQEPEA